MRFTGMCAAGLVAGAALLLGTTGCEHGYVAVGGEPGYVQAYDYDYYPDAEVYYYPAGSLYYWRDHDEWRHGRELPRNFHVDRNNRVALHLHTARPYEMHNQVRAEHPGRHVVEERH